MVFKITEKDIRGFVQSFVEKQAAFLGDEIKYLDMVVIKGPHTKPHTEGPSIREYQKFVDFLNPFCEKQGIPIVEQTSHINRRHETYFLEVNFSEKRISVAELMGLFNFRGRDPKLETSDNAGLTRLHISWFNLNDAKNRNSLESLAQKNADTTNILVTSYSKLGRYESSEHATQVVRYSL